MYVCISVHEYVQVYVGAHGDQKQVLDPLELDIWDVMNNFTWAKEAESRPSKRVKSPHHQAISPAQEQEPWEEVINVHPYVPHFLF